MSVGSIASPLMGYADRFVIAAVVSAAAVSYYATPHELVTKVWIVPAALTAVLFPTFAATVERHDAQAWPLAMRAVRWLASGLLPLTLGLALFADALRAAWVGADFAAHSAPLLRLLSAGIFVNCLAHVPLALLQGRGQARAPALLQAVQVVPYVALLALATHAFGLPGAAWAWLARMIFDTSAMYHLAARHAGVAAPWRFGYPVRAAAIVAAAAFAASAFDMPLWLRALAWLGASALAALLLRPWGSRAAALPSGT
jgi:O-antigen/teichoic acid export membrane protein